MRRFEFSKGTSNKFWEVAQDGTSLTTRWGRIGAKGQERTKTFPSPEAAKKEHDKLVARKLKEGYVPAPAPSPEEPVEVIALRGFDPDGEPEVRRMPDGSLHLVLNFMPPSWMADEPIDGFDAQLSSALGLPVVWEDREVFRIQGPGAGTVRAIEDFLIRFRREKAPRKRVSPAKRLKTDLEGPLRSVGFRWRRMAQSSDGWFVRSWDGGRDFVGFAHYPDVTGYRLALFAQLRIESVATLVAPCLGFVAPEFAADYGHHFWRLDAEGVARDVNFQFEVRSESDHQRVVESIVRVIRDVVAPLLETIRTPEALREATPSHRHDDLVALALAFLCQSQDERTLRDAVMRRAKEWDDLERERLEKLLKGWKR